MKRVGVIHAGAVARLKSASEGYGVGNSMRKNHTNPSNVEAQAIKAFRLLRNGDTPSLNFPPLGRKINQECPPFPVSPKGDKGKGREAPQTPPRAGGSPYKRVFKALRRKRPCHSPSEGYCRRAKLTLFGSGVARSNPLNGCEIDLCPSNSMIRPLISVIAPVGAICGPA